ncbi:plant dual-specificity MAP kinase kinase family domain protein (macronuclear) [Tetrahymena thermophila SB210]|uniref:non-specific serine/threonine protein kinase n=1 Tax=Tetrahymena thermophila (strain SB210) TaxID=312017 RepID=Q23RV4_TETTS|nr:plant dual-specificity MAP kinase kinase family domain protein [Tetrahymena thermophila SB210]EAR99285.2 plant dual-specificity MAP kinase kinase family domain protein [Tetrahymena thermophila SB210]|eukprot:XP_001019530.2 plant dual-specificity MAP kinase kinase family domain protein [Tetrahymena thermophila SB210]
MSLKDFQIVQKLGEGAYSSVYKVKRYGDGQEYALKKVKLQNLSEKEKQNALNEVRILASIRANNIVGYKEAFLDEMSNSLCIIMEYANNGDLFQKIVDHQKKGQLFPEQEIWNIFIQMVKGIKSLHDLKIFHRDLKSANVFLNKDGTVKLGDMNVSKVAKKGLLYTQTGTPYYASPEVWKDQPYDAKSDIWSLGCVLYEMTTLKPPFRAEDMEGLYKKVIRGYYPRIPPHFSQDLANVIRALLQVAPHLRPSADKILQLPAVIKRVNDSHLLEVDEGVPFLLTTIRVPKNLHYLTDRLPKPNYAPLKMKKIEKQRFLQTLAGYRGERNASPMDDDEQSQASQIITQTQTQQQEKGQQQILHLPKINPKVQKNLPSAQAAPTQDTGSHNNSQLISNNNNNGSSNYIGSNHKDKDSDANSINQSIINDHNSIKKKKKKQPEYDQNSSVVSATNINKDISLLISSPQNAGANQQNKPQKKDYNDKQKYEVLEVIRQIKYYDYPQQGAPKGSKQYQQSSQGSIQSLAQVQGQSVHQHQAQYDSLSPNRRKKNDNLNLLDIEGESKPLLKKNRKNPSIHNSPNNKYDDISVSSKNPVLEESNKLPSIGITKLPKIQGLAGNQGIDSKLLAIQQPKIVNDKENQKIREISRAYKVNINQLDDIKDRYRSIKRMEQSKSKQYVLKNSSLPSSNQQQLEIGGNQKYYNYSLVDPSSGQHSKNK